MHLMHAQNWAYTLLGTPLPCVLCAAGTGGGSSCQCQSQVDKSSICMTSGSNHSCCQPSD